MASMETVGELLKKARERKDISLDEVTKATKIKRKFLEVIEADDFSSMPSSTAAGFIQNYAQFLGLSKKRVLGAFRRDTKPKLEKRIVPEGIAGQRNKARFSWSPKTTLILAILIAFFFLLSYLAYQYFSLRRSPKLDLLQPQEGQRFGEKQLLILGRTDPDVVVTINGSLASLSSKGEFRFYLELLSGENKIIVEATNRIGKKTRVERVVWVVDEEKE